MTDKELLEAAAEAAHDAAFGAFSPWATLDEISRNVSRASTKAALEVFRREQGARDEALRAQFDECYGLVNRGWSVMRRVAREEATDEDVNDASMCLARAKTRVMVLAELTLGVAAPATEENTDAR